MGVLSHLALVTILFVVFGTVAYRVLLALSRPRWELLLRQVFCTRFSWLVGLSPIVLWIASRALWPELLANLFVLAGWFQFFLIGLLSLAIAVMALITSAVALANAPVRFSAYRALLSPDPPLPQEARTGWQVWQGPKWLLLFLLAGPVPAVCLWETALDEPAPGLQKVLVVGRALLGIALGFAVALLWLWLFGLAQRRVLHPCEILPGLLPLDWRPKPPKEPAAASGWRAWLAGALDGCGPGYCQAKGTRFSPGHAQALLLFVLVLVAYFTVYGAVLLKALPLSGEWHPPLASALMLLLMLGFLLPGLSFCLDYYNLSVLVLALALSAALFWFNDSDHYYVLNPDIQQPVYPQVVVLLLLALAIALAALALAALSWWIAQPLLVLSAVFCFLAVRTATTAKQPAPEPGARARPDTFLDASKNWDKKHKARAGGPDEPADRLLVVVTASGGGIQASAWSARVLTGLHERYGWRFTRSIRLISAVSGGSLGTAYYLANWDEQRGQTEDPFREPAEDERRPDQFRRLKLINELACRSSLEASAWGLAYPDLLRFAFPPLVPDYVDRGWALEEAWRKSLRDCGPQRFHWRLLDLAGPVRAGRIPAVVFNATLAETGRRLLISPLVRKEIISTHPAAVELLHLFPGDANPYVSTAVRLSAAFPYVSPISRARYRYAIPEPDAPLQDCHVVDGGYVDNEGAFTAIEWIDDLLEMYGPRGKGQADAPFDRVVVIRIFPFPAGAGERPAPAGRGWANEFTGPITALQNVRMASQQERNSFALEVFRRDHNPEWNVFKAYEDRLKDLAKKGDGEQPGRPVRILPVDEVRFYFQPTEGVVVPLSWKLTQRQRAAIELAWTKLLQYEKDKSEWQGPQENQTAPDPYYPLEKLDQWFDVVWSPG